MNDLSFAALDFETANGKRSSVCQAGITIVEAGEVTATHSWLVVPPTGAESFTNSGIHGITADDVQARGRQWINVESDLRALIGDLPVVAHHVPFDKSVYRWSNDAVGVEHAAWDWYCTSKLCKALTPGIADGKLKTACSHHGVDMGTHHDAGDDSRASALLALTLAQSSGRHTLGALWAGIGPSNPAAAATRSTGISQERFLDFKSRKYTKNADMPPTNPDAPESPLKGQTVFVTGHEPDWPKDALIEALALAGAKPEAAVTGRTTILVVGSVDSGAGRISKAEALIDKGKDIDIMPGEELLELLELVVTAESFGSRG